MRADKTHGVNLRVAKHFKAAWGPRRLVDITPDDVQFYLRSRLRQLVRIRTSLGYKDRGPVKPTSLHQEFRVLRRLLNVAVRKKILPGNPCSGAEFPVPVKGLFRLHYLTWTEQGRIETCAPRYLRNIVRIITETGLRVYEELMPMKKPQVDLKNQLLAYRIPRPRTVLLTCH